MAEAKASVQDAELIMKLYDLRREARLREARNYMTAKFFPTSYEDFQKISMARGSDENAFVRQVLSYWDMAASFVVHGVLNADLFFENCPEMWLIYTKFKPFLAQIRKDNDMPTFIKNIEQVAEATEAGRARVQMFTKRIQQMMATAK